MTNQETSVATQTVMTEQVGEIADASSVIILPGMTPATPTDAVAVTTAVVTEQPVVQQENTSGAAGWLWIAGLLLAALIAAVVVVLKVSRKPAAKTAAKPAAPARNVSAVPATSKVEAIGATEANAAAPAMALPAYAVGCAQTIGGRPYQEDSYGASDCHNANLLATRGLLGIMADGVGGLSNGQAASGAVVRGMLNIFAQQDPTRSGSNRLLEMAAFAQSEVLKLNQQGGSSGSTMVSVLIKGYDMNFISVGDSRIALARAGGLMALNREHVLARETDEDAAMGRGAAVTDERRRKAITSYMGKEKLTLIDRNVQPIKLLPGDRLVLMSDGVFGTLDDQTILSKLRLSPEQAAKAIIQAVDERKLPHQDNATVVVIGIG